MITKEGLVLGNSEPGNTEVQDSVPVSLCLCVRVSLRQGFLIRAQTVSNSLCGKDDFEPLTLCAEMTVPHTGQEFD